MMTSQHRCRRYRGNQSGRNHHESALHSAEAALASCFIFHGRLSLFPSRNRASAIFFGLAPNSVGSLCNRWRNLLGALPQTMGAGA